MVLLDRGSTFAPTALRVAFPGRSSKKDGFRLSMTHWGSIPTRFARLNQLQCAYIPRHNSPQVSGHG